MNRYCLNIVLALVMFYSNKTYTQKIDTNFHIINTYKYDMYTGLLNDNSFDTTVFVMSRYNPLYDYSNLNIYLGNLGSASLSQAFSDRPDMPYLFGCGYEPYLFNVNSYTIYRTKKPFTSVKFIIGGIEGESEERTLDLLHTQNINEYWNAGFKVRTIEAEGFYDYQENRFLNLSLFSSYIREKFNTHIAVNRNVTSNEENGGVVDSTFENGEDDGIEYQFSPELEMYSRYRNINFQISSELKLINFSKKQVKSSAPSNKFLNVDSTFTDALLVDKRHSDSLQTDTLRGDTVLIDDGILIEENLSKTAIIIGQLTDFNSYYRNLSIEGPLDILEFGIGVIDPLRTHDSTYYRSFLNRLYVKFKSGNQFITAGIENEFLKHVYNTVPDTNFISNQTGNVTLYNEGDITKYKTKKDFNTALFGDIEFNMSNVVKLKFIGKYYVLGYQLATLQLAGKARINLKNNRISVSSRLHTWRPDRFYNEYISNYFQWSNYNMLNTRQWDTEFLIKNKKQYTGVKVNYNILDNWIYFNENAMPIQNNGVTSILTAKFFGEFNIWKIKTKNEIAYQESNQNIIPLPRLSLFHSSSFHFKLANDVMHVNIGYDLFYFTPYFSNAYMPVTGIFHNQNERKVGNYPFLDVYGGFKVKRTLFFLKYEHVTQWFLDRTYYTTLHYPNPGRVLRIGLTWIFFN